MASIGVYTQFQHQPSQPVLDSMEREVTSIMSPAGLHFEWRSLADHPPTEPYDDLAVATFFGRCSLCDLTQHIETRALGWTLISDGEVLAFCEIHCDRIRAFVQPSLVLFQTEGREEAFGRAVGRVLAHELYHIFSRTKHHGSSGLAKSSHSVRELMTGDFRLGEEEVRTIEALMARRHGRPAQGETVFTGQERPH